MKQNARQSIVKAVFETLEGRSYMSATVGLQNGVLTVQADANAASKMVVEFTADHNYLQAYSAGSDGTLVKQTFAVDQVNSISMVGSKGDDWIYVDPRLGISASIQGGAGNDTIKGGTGLDTIDGGDGNDLIYGKGLLSTGAGNDTVWSCGQSDTIIGGSGDDLLIGGPGNEVIYGGSGDSTLISGQGNDTLYAGTGNQILYGANGQDTLVDGTGNDTIYGGAGANVIIARNPQTQVHALPNNTIQTSGTVGSQTPPPVQFPPVLSPPVVVSPAPPPAPPPVVAPPVQQPSTQPSDGTSPTAVISAMESTILAGEGVNVNGLNSVLPTGTALTTQYHWNFGDPTSHYNDLTGWNAGHVYDLPGVYTITLQVTDSAGAVSTATSQVTVNADTRPVIYVDTNGSDSNSGASPDQAVQTAARAFQLAGSDTKVEFRRGETFNVNTTLYLNGHDMYVGAYGTGADPVLMRGDGDGRATLYPGANAQNITIQHITFDSPYVAVDGVAPHINPLAIWGQGTDLVVRDCTFLNVDDAVNGAGQPHGVIVMDNNAPSLTGIRGYLCWVQGTDWSIIGNNVANSTREHVVRSSDVNTARVLIAGNNFAKVMRPEDPGEIYKTTINFRGGSYIYVLGNTLSGATVSFGPDKYMADGAEAAWIVVQGNFLHNSQLQLHGATHHVMVDDNYFDNSGTSQINLDLDDPTYADRHLSDITITENTGVNAGTAGQFVAVWGHGPAGVITLTNNLYVTTTDRLGWNTNSAVAVYDTPDLSMFKLIAGNIWPAPGGQNQNAPSAVNYIAGSAYPNGYLSPDQWNAQSEVQDDQFDNASLPGGTYQMTLNGVTAGSTGLLMAA